MRYLARRMFHGLSLLAGASVLTFVLVNAAPGEFVDELRVDPRISPESIAALRARDGLDRSLPVRYLYWVRSVAIGEGGFSLAYNSPAACIIWPRARNTLLLTATATLFAWLIALPFGMWSAVSAGKWPDFLGSLTVSLLLALPDLILALLLLLIAVRSGRFPIGGIAGLEFASLNFVAQLKDIARHLFLPGLCLALGFLPLLLSHIRASMTEVLDSPFIAAAHAHGIPLPRLLLRHALPAAANPLISLFGYSIGILLSSSVVVEGVFAWPGLGQLLIQAILQRDFYVVVDATMLATLLLIFGNLLADVLLYAADPRIRAE